jgi:hypothetical protein
MLIIDLDIKILGAAHGGGGVAAARLRRSSLKRLY